MRGKSACAASGRGRACALARADGDQPDRQDDRLRRRDGIETRLRLRSPARHKAAGAALAL